MYAGLVCSPPLPHLSCSSRHYLASHQFCHISLVLIKVSPIKSELFHATVAWMML